jgi:hypothetical protein
MVGGLHFTQQRGQGHFTEQMVYGTKGNQNTYPRRLENN